MLSLRSVHRSFGERIILADASWRLLPGERVALVGPNGAGKTTFMRLLAGVDEPDRGTVERPGHWRIGWLPQEPPDLGSRTLSEVLWDGLPEIRASAAALADVGAKLLQATGKELERLVHEQDRLHAEFERLGGHAADASVGRVAHGLGFSPGDLNRSMDEFSGGWRVKAALGRLLVGEPEVLLLDEPTNHLDLEAIAWLERHLADRPWGLVVVSHDRSFLDAVATRVTALDHGRLRDWASGYTRHLELREAEDEALEAAADRQDREHARVRRFIERFRASARRSRQARSRERALEREVRIERPAGAAPRLRVDLGDATGVPTEVLRLRRVGQAYDGRAILEGLDLVVERGMKVALAGPNGVGKSTLLRLLAGVEVPSTGDVRWTAGVLPGYLAQHAAVPDEGRRSVFETAWAHAPPGWTLQEVRDLLAAFLFRGDAVERPVSVLSGGERSRLALATLLLSPRHVLLLDEPTNHLDIGAREVLAEALAGFEGAVVFSSHDRWLLRTVATHVLAWPGPMLFRAEDDGDWTSIMAHMASTSESPVSPASTAPPPVAAPDPVRPRFNAFKHARAVAEVDEALESIARERENFLQLLGLPGPEAAAAAHRLAALEQRQSELEARWLELAEQAEEAGHTPQ
ncbi:MAG: ABC-F family ATP-binding cassette domain-containing protein [Candidatus Sericytochromatia bacterium]|nr:ABC-F family ATP-binding cassette domain-containing protein [Candidatus Sericytochromatia bacterium]